MSIRQFRDRPSSLEVAQHIPAARASRTRAGIADRAVEYLEKSADARESLILDLAIDSLFERIRKDPRFVALGTKIGLNVN